MFSRQIKFLSPYLQKLKLKILFCVSEKYFVNNVDRKRVFEVYNRWIRWRNSNILSIIYFWRSYPHAHSLSIRVCVSVGVGAWCNYLNGWEATQFSACGGYAYHFPVVLEFYRNCYLELLSTRLRFTISFSPQ